MKLPKNLASAGMNPALAQAQFQAKMQMALKMEDELAAMEMEVSNAKCQYRFAGNGCPLKLEVFEDCTPADILDCLDRAYIQFSTLRDQEAKKLIGGGS